MNKLNLIWIMALCLLFFASCKKSNPPRTFSVRITNITKTKYDITVTNLTQGGSLMSLEGQSTEASYNLGANAGDDIQVKYYFTTTGKEFGQGNIDVEYNSKKLLHVNGGHSDGQTFKLP